MLLAAVLALLAAAYGAPSTDGWQRLWRRSPSDFSARASHTLQATLDRLLQGPRVGGRAPPPTRKATDDTGALQLLLQVWRQRDNPAFLLESAERLAALVQDERGVDELERYLPQLGHLILQLPADSLLTTVLERFALRVSETNVHWALQLIWTVYSNLEENRPERPGSSPEVFARAARLLQLIEQSVVYGAKLVNRDKLRTAALARNVQIWIDQLQEKYARDDRAVAAADGSVSRDDASGGGGGGLRQGSASVATLREEGRAAPSAAVAKAEASPPAIEGWLHKRKARDSFGCWRCFGQSWSRRWFSLRDCVLYYYPRGVGRASGVARGAMPLGQCRIELRPSRQGGGPYIKISARFTHSVMRLRGSSPAETSRWLHALRSSAGLTPLGFSMLNAAPTHAAATARPPQPTPAALTDGSTAATDATGSTAATGASAPAASDGTAPAGASSSASAGAGAAASGAEVDPPLPPLGILEELSSADLTMSQRCSYLYLAAQRDFVRALAALSEALYTPGGTGLANAKQPQPAEAKRRLERMLAVLRAEVQPLAYVPLCSSSSVFAPVARLPEGEASVFVTRARASVLLHIETIANPRRRKLSQLFQAVRVERPERVFDGLGVPRWRAAGGESGYKAGLGWFRRRSLPAPLDVFSWGADEEEADDASAAAAAAATREAHLRLPPSAAPAAAATAETAPPSPPSTVGGTASLDTVFGEAWAARVRRVQRASPLGREPGWGLLSVISKANDDVRQEAFIMQVLSLFDDAFPAPLRLRPYHILSTGPRSGLIETVTDTKSLDQLKKRPGFVTLRQHYERHYGAPSSARFVAAQKNFAASLAAYSVACYVLAIKDRHNGNILLDREGHLIHIDFGFVLGGAPGGPMSFACPERDVPFKLTREMVDVLGGANSPLYRETFVDLCTAAMRAVRKHAATLISLCEITAFRSELPCFASGGEAPVQQLRERLMLDLPDVELRDRVASLIARSYDHRGTIAYDLYQQYSNGIRS